MNKKGLIAYNQINWIIRIIVVLVVFIMVGIVVFYIVNVTFATEAGEMDLFADRLLYSPSGISLHDQLSNRIYPGIIDMERLESGRWRESVDYGDKNYIAAKLTLVDKEGEQLRADYFNEEKYDEWFVQKGLQGRGGVVEHTKTVYVLIDGGEEKRKPASLEIHMVTPKK